MENEPEAQPHMAAGGASPPLDTFMLPAGLGWSVRAAQFGAATLPIVQPSPAQLGALASQLSSSAAALRRIPIATIVAAIGRVAERWLDPDLPERRALESILPAINGYSAAMVQHTIGRMAADWRAEALWGRLRAEFGDPAVLDDWRPYPRQPSPMLTRAWGPRLILHICAGNVPGVAIQSLLDALLVKSPCLLKPASGEPLWATLWVRMLVAELPELAASLAVVWWAGGDLEREAAVLAQAEALIVNASNQAIADLRRRLPAHVRLVDYGSRISFAVVADRMITPARLPALARALAYDVALFEQSGCVSPQMIFLESPTEGAASTLAEALDRALAELDRELPGAPAAAIATRRRRDEYEWRMLAGHPATLFGPEDGRWAIVVDQTAAFGPVNAARTIIIRPVADLAELPLLLTPLGAFLQSAALAAPPERFRELATLLASAGVTRLTRIGQQGWPSPLWHHDGRDPLRSLIRWSDIECQE
jgi:hypothetical protein